MKILYIDNKNLLVDDELIKSFVKRSGLKFDLEYILLDELNKNIIAEGLEMDCYKKKEFKIDDYMPNNCVLHLTNNVSDNIYLYNDGSIEIGKSYDKNNVNLTQLSYKQIQKINDYVMAKGYIKDE